MRSHIATPSLVAVLALLAATSLSLPVASAQSATQCGFGTPSGGSQTSPANFDSDFVGSSGWLLQSSHPSVKWQVIHASTRNPAGDAVGHSETGRLYYGFPNKTTSNYKTGTNSNNGTATSPAFRVPTGASNAVLYFASSYEIEASEPATRDLVQVETSTNSGATWTLRCGLNPSSNGSGAPPSATLCSNGSPGGAKPCPAEPNGPVWEARKIALDSSVAGRDVLVRFTFRTVDGLSNEGMGWMLDDIRIGYTPPVACNDGTDNDGDNKIDYPNDPGCTSSADTDESNGPECSDGIDNDGDGRTDFPNDPDCSSSTDPTESAPPPQCSDGIDNDGDGRTDYPNDPGCTSTSDNSEVNSSGGSVPVMSPLATFALATVLAIGGAMMISYRNRPKKD